MKAELERKKTRSFSLDSKKEREGGKEEKKARKEKEAERKEGRKEREFRLLAFFQNDYEAG